MYFKRAIKKSSNAKHYILLLLAYFACKWLTWMCSDQIVPTTGYRLFFLREPQEGGPTHTPPYSGSQTYAPDYKYTVITTLTIATKTTISQMSTLTHIFLFPSFRTFVPE